MCKAPLYRGRLAQHMFYIGEGIAISVFCPMNWGWSVRFRLEGIDNSAFPFMPIKNSSNYHCLTWTFEHSSLAPSWRGKLCLVRHLPNNTMMTFRWGCYSIESFFTKVFLELVMLACKLDTKIELLVFSICAKDKLNFSFWWEKRKRKRTMFK